MAKESDRLLAEVEELRAEDERLAVKILETRLLAEASNELTALRAENSRLKDDKMRLREALAALADEYADPDLPSEGPAYRAAIRAMKEAE